MAKVKGNKAKIEIVRKYARCGGYDGNGKFSGPETIFGMYLDVIEQSCDVIAKTREFGPNDKEKVGALQQEIDEVVRLLTGYAQKCIDTKNFTINYDHNDFIKTFENYPKIADNFANMRYYIAFVAMQKGFSLCNENDVINAQSMDLCDVRIKKCPPQNVDNMRNLVYQTQAYYGQRD